jgi:hypothetical protein
MGAGIGRQYPTERSVPGGFQPLRPSQSIHPLQPIPPLQPLQPIQPMHGTGPGQGFSFGDLHTMNLPGAPKLPPNPLADAAWRRRMNGPK